jgi:N-acetylglucosamine kinase-like BadF-type ATPase
VRILNQAAIEVVELVERLVEQQLPEAHDVPLVVTGGLWEQRGLLQPLLQQEIEIRNLPVTIAEKAGGELEGGLAILRDGRREKG